MANIVDMLQGKIDKEVSFVAEIGINHDGDISLVKKMIDAAIESKADAVKFQLYNTDLFYNKFIAQSGHELFKSFEIPYKDFLVLKNYGESRGIQVFGAAFDTDTFKSLIQDQIFPIKIASGDALTEVWIDELLDKGIPFIISTGSLYADEIQKLGTKIKGSDSAMLYCVSEYPAPPEGFDLRYINVMQDYIPNQIIGFSDHSRGIALSLGAIANGAKIIERHFTLFPQRQDLDHPISLSPEQFFDMVDSGKMISKALGNGHREPTLVEKKVRSLAGRDAYASCNILKGTIISEDMIVLQRPGEGIKTSEYKSLIGQTTKQDIPEGTLLRTIFL